MWLNYLTQVSEASSVKPMKKAARMQINKSTFFLIVALTYSTSAFSDDLQILPFAKPDLNFSSIFSQKAATDFSSIQDATRSSSGDAGSPQNVFLKVLPSAVKVLTNDGHGTGVVISKKNNGYLITNHHVIDGYQTVGLVFGTDQDNDAVTLGEVVRYDEVSDLALVRLKTEKPGILPIEINKDGIQIGDDVHAVGHPLGEDWTYTRGYVSQQRKNYSWQTDVGEHHVADVIQTQTPINPGNSGGPLVDNFGRLVGINSFRSGRGEGINFAVANSTVQKFLKSQASVQRPSIPEEFRENLVSTGDDNKNGVVDLYFWDDNKNEIWDTLGIDTDEDLTLDQLAFDENENDVFELVIVWKYLDGELTGIYYSDENEDGEDDFVSFDFDLDGKIDETIEAEK